jgi:hypothetical protein
MPWASWIEIRAARRAREVFCPPSSLPFSVLHSCPVLIVSSCVAVFATRAFSGVRFYACDGEGLPEGMRFAADTLEHYPSTANSPAFACSLCPFPLPP